MHHLHVADDIFSNTLITNRNVRNYYCEKLFIRNNIFRWISRLYKFMNLRMFSFQ